MPLVTGERHSAKPAQPAPSLAPAMLLRSPIRATPYRHGCGNSQNPGVARRLCQQAIDMGFSPAQGGIDDLDAETKGDPPSGEGGGP
jgi:hypothetical protein